MSINDVLVYWNNGTLSNIGQPCTFGFYDFNLSGQYIYGHINEFKSFTFPDCSSMIYHGDPCDPGYVVEICNCSSGCIDITIRNTECFYFTGNSIIYNCYEKNPENYVWLLSFLWVIVYWVIIYYELTILNEPSELSLLEYETFHSLKVNKKVKDGYYETYNDYIVCPISSCVKGKIFGATELTCDNCKGRGYFVIENERWHPAQYSIVEEVKTKKNFENKEKYHQYIEEEKTKFARELKLHKKKCLSMSNIKYLMILRESFTVTIILITIMIPESECSFNCANNNLESCICYNNHSGFNRNKLFSLLISILTSIPHFCLRISGSSLVSCLNAYDRLK